MAKSKKRRSCLTLVPQPGKLVLSDNQPVREALSALTSYTPQPRDVSLMLHEGRKQILAIQIDKIKTAYAASAVADLAEHNTVIFDATSGRIVNRKALAREEEHAAYYDEFATLMLQLTARSLVQIQMTGEGLIIRELEPSVYVAHKEPSWLDKLLGRE